MRARYSVLLSLFAVLFLFGCASQPEPAPEEQEPEVAETPDPEVLEASVRFVDATGRVFENASTVRLPTGGPPQGRVIPEADDGVILYVTRDGSVPGPDNNWGGAIQPGEVVPISRSLEGAATYSVVGVENDLTSAPVVLNVIWEHEENPELDRPRFLVDGSRVSGSVELPVSDGTEPSARIAIECDYLTGTLYVTRDGTDPSPDNYWETQQCHGTFIFAPEETSAEYRVVLAWQGSVSPVARISVDWVASE